MAKNLDDVLRAAWFARLAFGCDPGEAQRNDKTSMRNPAFIKQAIDLGC